MIEQYEPSERERELNSTMFSAYDELRRLGWQEAFYAPQLKPLWLIEAGSTGFHAGFRDGESFWVTDRMDTWPSHPMLFKARE